MSERQQSYWADSWRDKIDETDGLPIAMKDALITAVTLVDNPGQIVPIIKETIKGKSSPKDPLSK